MLYRSSVMIAMILISPFISNGSDEIPMNGLRDIQIGSKKYHRARYEMSQLGFGVRDDNGWHRVRWEELPMSDIIMFLPMEIRDSSGHSYGLCQIMKVDAYEIMFIEVGTSYPKTFTLEGRKLDYLLRRQLGMLKDPIKRVAE